MQCSKWAIDFRLDGGDSVNKGPMLVDSPDGAAELLISSLLSSRSSDTLVSIFQSAITVTAITVSPPDGSVTRSAYRFS